MASITTTRPASAAPASRDWLRVSKRTLGYGVLLFFAFLYLMPFLLALSASFKTRAEVAASPLALMPAEITTAAWQ